MMDIFGQLRKLLGIGDQPQAKPGYAATPQQQVSAPLEQAYGNHSGFQRMPDGRAMVGGQVYPASAQEDNFTFDSKPPFKYQGQQTPGTVNGHTPAPGYYNQAVQYNNDMNSGNFNGQDPGNFGYPADNGLNFSQTPTTSFENILKQLRR